MKHAFIMNCHKNLPQAVRSIQLYRRFWSEKSEFYFYYDGPRTLDCFPHLWQIKPLCTRLFLGPYEPVKATSIFNAINAMTKYALERGIDSVTFAHEDVIPLFPSQFYAFVDRFWKSGKAMTYSKIWPRVDYIDFINLHFNVKKAYETNILPFYKVVPEANYNEWEAMLSFQERSPDWRDHIYRMWSMAWPLTNSAVMHPDIPPHYHPFADKTAHDQFGTFVYHNYVPETTLIHVNDDYFWENYATLSDAKETAPLQKILDDLTKDDPPAEPELERAAS